MKKSLITSLTLAIAIAIPTSIAVDSVVEDAINSASRAINLTVDGKAIADADKNLKAQFAQGFIINKIYNMMEADLKRGVLPCRDYVRYLADIANGKRNVSEVENYTYALKYLQDQGIRVNACDGEGGTVSPESIRSTFGGNTLRNAVQSQAASPTSP